VYFLQKIYPNEFDRNNWYAAKIIATLKAINSKESVSVNDQLTEFITEEAEPQYPTTEEERLAWIARSKAGWAAALGISI